MLLQCGSFCADGIALTTGVSECSLHRKQSWMESSWFKGNNSHPGITWIKNKI